MSSIEELLNRCEERIGHQFADRSLLRRCLTHSSSAETRLDCNERLEFLGDAVLGIVICEHLFQIYPEQREGNLTQMKSSLVSRQTCAKVARQLELQSFILVGRGLQNIPDSLLSAVVESVIAGIYLDGGLQAARQFILSAFEEELSLCGPVDTENFKSRLQEHTQRVLGKTPEYVLVEENGPDHAREFCISARVGSDMFDSGRGRSKKEAEQQAARNALLSLMRASMTECHPCDEDEDLAAESAGSDENVISDVMAVIELNQSTDEVFEFGTGCEPDGDREVERDNQAVSQPTESFALNVSEGKIERMPVKTTVCDVFFRPESAELRFLPEGPYVYGSDQFSWVGIQHGATSTVGSINVFDLKTGRNQSFGLPGRPGFAFPTDRPGVFVTGVEREVGLFDTSNGTWMPFVHNVDSNVTNTIINDAVVFEDCLVFGCKELEFTTQKAGLYLWRRSDGATVQLRNDQICSNGKAIVRNSDGSLTLYDIDSCTKQIVKSTIDINAGTVGPLEVVVDLTSGSVFPDGMILTPDHKSLIVALYDPGDPDAGAARQYSIATGELEAVWTCPGSPRVTCPQLLNVDGRVRLLLTTAVEHMPAEQQEKHPNAGCLFIGETNFTSIGDQPIFRAV